MPRLLLFCLLFLLTGLGWSAQAQSGPNDVPARPNPFRFVTDEGQLLSQADAKTLESGLRRYADNTGTQIVVVTVPTLGRRSAADYGRALGAAWGVGQRDQDNGVVILVAKQERAVTIQAGSGLRRQLTPAVTDRIISQDMTPRFRQGNYFAGLKAGLNTLMLAANPSSDPRKNQPAAAAAPAETPAAASYSAPSEEPAASAAVPEPTAPVAAEPASSGFGLGTLVLAVVVIGGGLWLVSKLFRRRSNGPDSPAGRAPDFLPNQPNNPGGSYDRGGHSQSQAPDFLPNRSPGLGGSTGSGMGGVLLTGAAAAAGAYLGNRMANGSDDQHAPAHLNPDNPPLRPLDSDPAVGTGAGFPFLGNDASAEQTGPDYFAPDDNSADNGPDYFTSDDSGPSTYDDPSSGDTGGGGFDDPNDNTGTW